MIQVKKKKVSFGILLGTFISVVLLVFIIGGINQAKKSISGNAKERLYEAIKNTAIHAYAIEGQYPVNIEYMKANYGLRYDEERFFVDYEMIAGNIIPDIFIVDNEEEVVENDSIS